MDFMLNNLRSLIKYLFLYFLILIIFASCEESVYTPRPRAFPRVLYPERNYVQFDAGYCNFTFQYPDYLNIEQDTLFFDKKPDHPCWFDLVMPSFDGKVHFSYHPISKRQSLYKLTEDSYKLSSKHNVKAEFIDDNRIFLPKQKTYGLKFSIDGPVASPFQFFVTDSTTHFLRASLYFNTNPRPDSMKPIIDFVRLDLENIINTFEWNE